MIRTLLIAGSIAFSTAVVAAPTWMQVASTADSAILIDRSSVAEMGEFQSVRILRNYEGLMSLGNDPVTREAWYPHRSVKLRYVADCRTGKVAVDAWQMYSGNFGDGEVVWADHRFGVLAFVMPSFDEEESALKTACSEPAAYSLTASTR